MERIGTFIATHPKRVLAITALVTLTAALSLFRIQFNADVASFITEGNERGEAFAALTEKYDTADPVNVILSLPEGESFTERDRLVDVAEFRDEIAACRSANRDSLEPTGRNSTLGVRPARRLLR